MTKHLVDINPELLERARSVAGTATIKATVEAGLRQLADLEVAQRHVRRLRGRGAVNLEKVRTARASRIPNRG